MIMNDLRMIALGIVIVLGALTLGSLAGIGAAQVAIAAREVMLRD